MAAQQLPVDRFQGWQRYPWNYGMPIAPPHEENPLKAGLIQAGRPIFSDAIDLRIIDLVTNDTQANRSAHYTSANDVEGLLLRDDRSKSRVRIISIHAGNSLGPLKITETLMRKICTFYKVDSNFLHILLSFGRPPHLSEASASNISDKLNEDNSRDFSYQLRYCEGNFRSHIQPISTRQTGVYHHHDSNDDFDVFILLHPCPKSQLEVQLIEICASRATAAAICANPYRIHMLPFLLYMDNWRWYFRRLGNSFEKLNDRIMTVGLSPQSTSSLHFDRVQELRNLRDETFSMGAHCRSANVVLKTIDRIPANGLTNAWSTTPLFNRLNGYDESVSVLNSRISNSMELHSYALDLKNQLMAAKTSEHVSYLAEKATHDTTSVKWITYLTLIYIPGSFVATLYGMNFFVFDQQRKVLVVATDFWLFAATWLPLTFITFLVYLLMRSYNKARQPEDEYQEASIAREYKG